MVAGLLARQAEGQPVTDMEPAPSPCPDLRAMPAKPEELQEGEGRIGAEAGPPDQPLAADRRQKPDELVRGARVVPGDHRMEGPTGPVDQRAGLADARHREPAHPGGRLDTRQGAADRLDRGLPERRGVVLALARAEDRGRRRHPVGRQHPMAGLDDDRADAARSGVDAAQQRPGRHGRPQPLRSSAASAPEAPSWMVARSALTIKIGARVLPDVAAEHDAAPADGHGRRNHVEHRPVAVELRAAGDQHGRRRAPDHAREALGCARIVGLEQVGPVLEGDPAGVGHHPRIVGVGDARMPARQRLDHHRHAAPEGLVADTGHDLERLELAAGTHEVHQAGAATAERLGLLEGVQKRPFRVREPGFLEDRGAAVEPEPGGHPADQPVAVALDHAERGHDAIGAGLDDGIDDPAGILEAGDRSHRPPVVHRHHELRLVQIPVHHVPVSLAVVDAVPSPPRTIASAQGAWKWSGRRAPVGTGPDPGPS